MPSTDAPRVRGPKDVLELRTWLHEQWQDGNAFDSVTRIIRGMHAELSRVERHTLEEATLWWVGEDMMDLLIAAIPSVPEDVRLEDLPDMPPCGLVVFAKPYVGLDTGSGLRIVEVNAITWGGVAMPPWARAEVRDPDHTFPAIAVSSYQFVPAGKRIIDGIGTEHESLGIDAWVPLGRSDWPLDERLGDWSLLNPMTLHHDDTQRDSAQEDRRLLAALWTFLDARAITQTVGVPVDRQARRRQERAGFQRNTITVATLRRVEHAVTDGEPTGRHYSHSFLVSGHWRNQPYGPARSQRRLQWIAPHIKGEGEFIPKDRVNAWKR